MDPFGEIMESAYYLEQQSIDPFGEIMERAYYLEQQSTELLFNDAFQNIS